MMSREFRYGLIAGFITLLWMAFGYWMGWDKTEMGTYAPFLSMFILIVAIYISILFKRDKDLGGAITFGNAFITGVSVSFVIGLMVGAFLVIYVEYINPDIVNEVAKQAEDYYKTQKGVTQDEINNAVNGAKALYSPFGQFTYGIGTTMLTGGLISLLCAAVMKRQEKLEVRS